MLLLKILGITFGIVFVLVVVFIAYLKIFVEPPEPYTKSFTNSSIKKQSNPPFSWIIVTLGLLVYLALNFYCRIDIFGDSANAWQIIPVLGGMALLFLILAYFTQSTSQNPRKLAPYEFVLMIAWPSILLLGMLKIHNLVALGGAKFSTPVAPSVTTAQLKEEPAAKKVVTITNKKSLLPEMVLIQPGKFRMGSLKSEKGRNSEGYYETQHEVTITKPFYLGKYEVTHEEWEGVMGNIPSDLKWKGAKLPVTQVSWVDCKEFIKKLNTKTDSGYRLPTEAEWEYACRAGTTTVYSFGDKITPKEANYSDSKIDKPVAVGSYKPNAFGLYDMHGNVFEWCENWYGDYPAGAVTDPKGPSTGKYRVLRGGAFNISESGARSSLRLYSSPTNRDFYFGFRLARTK